MMPISIRHHLRDGQIAQAKEIVEKFKDVHDFGFPAMAACMENRPAADVTARFQEEDARLLAYLDPEPRYVVAGDFVFCGQKDLALQLLKSSISANYCAYKGLQSDSLWAKLRGTPEFAELLSAAKQCRDNFISERSQAAH